ncbi:MAG TPA: arsenite S-adenosylmethyltransferase, partial [Gemmatimonadales bacterium]|nr:arsenite S-adenosylmethyltransferase [Gemmatimonadales bacterium]
RDAAERSARQCMELWGGCVAGALSEQEYEQRLGEAGFNEIGIQPTRVYELEDAWAFLSGSGLDSEVPAREVGGRIMGAFIRARKPAPTV